MVTRIPLRRFDDERGFFMELMRASAAAEARATGEPRTFARGA